MNDKIIEKLVNERYSVKQMIAYFIVGYLNTKGKKEFKEILNSILFQIINVNKTEILKIISVKNIADIDIYWSLTAEQMLCYAYIVFENLMKGNQKIQIQDIKNEFIVLAKLYSPSNAVEYVTNIK